MLKTYLPLRFHFYYVAVFLFLYFLQVPYLLLIGSILYFSLILLFRRGQVILVPTFYPSYFATQNIKENATKNSRGSIIYAPLRGKLIDVKRNTRHILFGEGLIRLRFAMPIISEMGIYLPAQVTIRDVFPSEGETYNRYSRKSPVFDSLEGLSGVTLLMETPIKSLIGLQIIECPIGAAPFIYVLPGDRGQAGAAIGCLPFGGTALLYLPGNFEILVEKNAMVIPGGSQMAVEKFK